MDLNTCTIPSKKAKLLSINLAFAYKEVVLKRREQILLFDGLFLLLKARNHQLLLKKQDKMSKKKWICGLRGKLAFSFCEMLYFSGKKQKWKYLFWLSYLYRHQYTTFIQTMVAHVSNFMIRFLYKLSRFWLYFFWAPFS